jgi:hypothetical protein
MIGSRAVLAPRLRVAHEFKAAHARQHEIDDRHIGAQFDCEPMRFRRSPSLQRAEPRRLKVLCVHLPHTSAQSSTSRIATFGRFHPRARASKLDNTLR